MKGKIISAEMKISKNMGSFISSILYIAGMSFGVGIIVAIIYQFFTLGFNIINKLIGMI